MKLINLISLIFFVFNSQAEKERRIAGGEYASLGQFPHHAHLEIFFNGNLFICGGTLVKYNWVVTAAHCVLNFQFVQVKLGLINREVGTIEGQFHIEDQTHVRVHPLYDPPDVLSNDIALIFLEQAEPSLLDNPYVGTIDLPIDMDNDFINHQVTATGFGRTSDDDPNPSVLLKFVNMTVISNQECSTQLPSELITNSKLCTSTESGRSTCAGDNGGGAFITENGIRILVGISSFYVDNCQQQIPAVFTRVTEFVGWLQENFANPPVVDIPLPTLPPIEDRGCNCECICETCPSFNEIKNKKKFKEL